MLQWAKLGYWYRLQHIGNDEKSGKGKEMRVIGNSHRNQALMSYMSVTGSGGYLWASEEIMPKCYPLPGYIGPKGLIRLVI